MKSVFKMVINLSDHLFIIDMLWAVCHKRLYWKPLTHAVCVKWDSGVKAAVILTTIMLDDSKRQCLFYWNIIYYILKGTLDLDFVLGLFIYWRLVFSLIGFFFQSTSQFCFGIVLRYYCFLSTILHTCYRCDILSTCITHVTARKQVFKTFWLPVEIIVDIILFWIYFAKQDVL